MIRKGESLWQNEQLNNRVIQEQLYDLEQPVWVREAIAVGKFYVDSLYRYLDVYDKAYDEYKEYDRYYHLLEAIEKQLNGYCDRKVRERYIWLKRALEKAMNYERKAIKSQINNMIEIIE